MMRHDRLVDDQEERSALGPDSDGLAASAARSRVADREVALALGRPEPSGAVTTAGYLDGLGRRAPLSADAERELVVAAQRGDAAA